jgi:hypothetical protein
MHNRATLKMKFLNITTSGVSTCVTRINRRYADFLHKAWNHSCLPLKGRPFDEILQYGEKQSNTSGPGSVVSIATGYGLGGPKIESRWEARFSATVQTGPEAHPSSCTIGTGSFPGVKSGQGVTLTPQPLLVPWSWKSRAITLLPLWAVRPVQSLGACTVELNLYSPYGPYGLYRASVPVQRCTLPVC